MPPRQAPATFEEMYAAEKQRQLPLLGEALAQRIGPPPGARRMSLSLIHI